MTPLSQIKATSDGHAVALSEDLYAFRVPKARFRHGQSYALLRGENIILIDAVHAITKEAVEELRRKYKVVALLITHSDLLQQAFDRMPALGAWLNCKVYAHPADHKGQDLEDVTKAKGFLQLYGLSAHAIPGHTAGSVVYYDQLEKRLFAGDAAIGNNYEKEGTAFTHAPIPSHWWEAFQEGWKTCPTPVEQVYPLHGQPDFEVENWEDFLGSMLDKRNVMRE